MALTSSRSRQYVCEQSWFGGGGYITGLIQHPSDPQTLYARCDVGGVFRTIDGARSWHAVNRGMTIAHHHSVQSIAISPNHPHVLLRCSGEPRGQRRFGTIHKSVDGGDNWYTVCSNVDYFGNGPTRMHAEVTAFDPFDPAFVMTGGYSEGVWNSSDEGEHWAYSGLVGQRITALAFHPAVPGRVYVSTAGDSVLAIKDQGKRWAHETMAEKLGRFGDFARGEGRLFRSDDRGRSWKLLTEGSDFVAFAFDPRDPLRLHAATLQHGICCSADGGNSWLEQSAGLPKNMAYNTIAISPQGVLYTAPDVRPQHTHLPPVPVYQSTSGGEDWTLIRQHCANDLVNYPDYMSVRSTGFAVSTLLVDAFEVERLYLCNWYGVARSDDAGQTWDANHFTGIETTCLEDIVTDPNVPGKVYITLGDYRPHVSDDNGATYHEIEVARVAHNRAASDSTALVASSHHPGFLLAGLTSRGNRPKPCSLLRSWDGGQTGEQCAVFGDELFVQALVEDAHVPGRFYAYLEGALADGAGLYRSDDWGSHWVNLHVTLPEHIQTLPHQARWIEAELLSVVVYQIKNACGTNQLLVSDPYRRDTVLLGEWTEGIFEITDDSIVRRVDAGLPFGRRKAAVLVSLNADVQQPGVFYAGFIAEGLWRTTDYGQHWHKLYPTDDSTFNASSVAIDGTRIVVACEPLHWSPVPSTVLCSDDRGDSWQVIYSGERGALRWKGIAIDRASGVIHACTCGNGCFRFITTNR